MWMTGKQFHPSVPRPRLPFFSSHQFQVSDEKTTKWVVQECNAKTIERQLIVSIESQKKQKSEMAAVHTSSGNNNKKMSAKKWLRKNRVVRRKWKTNKKKARSDIFNSNSRSSSLSVSLFQFFKSFSTLSSFGEYVYADKSGW